jgi:hypothetical protein
VGLLVSVWSLWGPAYRGAGERAPALFQ